MLSGAESENNNGVLQLADQSGQFASEKVICLMKIIMKLTGMAKSFPLIEILEEMISPLKSVVSRRESCSNASI